MIYLKYSFSIKENKSQLSEEIVFDVLSDFISGYGFDSFSQNGSVLDAFITEPNSENLVIDDILEGFPLAGVSFCYHIENMPDVNWNEEWEKNYFAPLYFCDGRCVVRAPFHKIDDNVEIELLISPKMAFGTGNHQTTSLMIDYIMSNDMKDKSVLDMGCGTGILGFLTLKRGAKSLVSIDIDKWAYDNVLENAELNGLVPNEVIHSDASALHGRGGFDIILANITRNILLQDMDKYSRALSDNGSIVFSGFFKEDIEAIVKRAKELGLIFKQSNTKDNWALVEVVKG